MTRRALLVLLAGAVMASATPFPARAETVVGEGLIQSDEKVGVKSPVTGFIRRLPVREGDVLSKGQVIVEIENDVQRAQVATALAEVRRAEAAVAEAEVTLESTAREYERNKTVPDLITDKELALSRDAMQSARAALATRKEELLKAQKQLLVAQENLQLTVIQAPFDGLVTRLYLREGDAPQPSVATILDFLSLEKLFVEIALPLPYLRRVREQLPVKLDVEGESPAIRTSVTGMVSYVYPEVDPVTRMFRVKIEVPRSGSRILPGLFAKARIELSRPAR